MNPIPDRAPKSPCCLPRVEIVHVASVAQARELAALGYCPIECSFGTESVVDGFAMDHHGSFSHLESVAVRACRDHLGVRKSDPRFVVTGAADADATLAIATLAGLLPTHPSRIAELLQLAALVHQADVSPIGLRLEETDLGIQLLLWKRLASGVQDATAFHAGVDRWRMLLSGRPPKSLLTAVQLEERDRVASARAAKVELHGSHVGFVESEVWGFDVWYAEVRPVIIAYVAASQRATIGCRDLETAKRLFGPAGLMSIYPQLAPAGWGGRETVGGSPRDARLTRDNAVSAARLLRRASELSPVSQNRPGRVE
jgi:hypothetical protein